MKFIALSHLFLTIGNNILRDISEFLTMLKFNIYVSFLTHNLKKFAK